MPLGTSPGRRASLRRRRRFKPEATSLEQRSLLTTASILTSASASSTTPPLTPLIDGTPTDPPVGPTVPRDALGIMHTAATNQSFPGYSVAYVGDVNGDSRDDYLIGAPNTTLVNGLPASQGPGGRVYLVFGSSAVGSTSVGNFLNNVNNVAVPAGNPQGRPPRNAIDERVGDLDQLGNRLGGTTQTSPINGQPGFSFNGLTFVTGQTPNSEIGAAVAAAGDINRDGFADFLIGTPGVNNNAGGAILVFGSSSLSTLPSFQRFIDFDTPTQIPASLVFTTFTTTVTGSRTGQSLAGVGDVIADAQTDIAIGAPLASTGGGLVNNGAVYLVSGAVFGASTPTTVNLNNIGLIGNTQGILLTGASSGDRAGWSVAGAGNFDGDTSSANRPIPDLLIGAPGNPYAANNRPGTAYLLYGAVNLLNQFTTSGTAPVIGLGTVGDTAAGASFAGASFIGESNNDLTGFAVSTAGNFNGTAPDDILIGSPGFALDSGRANLIYGRRTSQGRILGSFQLSAQDNGLSNLELQGTANGDLAGYAVGASQNINNDTINEILIGAPGTNANSGAIYLIAGNPNSRTGVVNLQQVISSAQPTDFLPGLQLTLALSQGYMGASVSGPLLQATQSSTVDADQFGDFLIGAPLHAPPFSGLGAGFLLEGGFIRNQGLLIVPQVGGGGDDDDDDDDDDPIGTGTVAGFDFISPNVASPQFGESFTPTPLQLSKLLYKPLRYQRAYRQFAPAAGFGLRNYNFFNPDKAIGRKFTGDSHKRDGVWTLPRKRLTTNQFGGTQSRFRIGQIPGRIDHGVPTIPVYLGNQRRIGRIE